MSVFTALTPTIFREKLSQLEADSIVLKNVPCEWSKTITEHTAAKINEIFSETMNHATSIFNPSRKHGVTFPIKLEARKNGVPIIYGQWMIVHTPRNTNCNQ